MTRSTCQRLSSPRARRAAALAAAALGCAVLLSSPARAADVDPVTPYSVAWLGMLVDAKCHVLGPIEGATLADDAKFLRDTLVEAQGSASKLAAETAFAENAAGRAEMKACSTDAEQTVRHAATKTHPYAEGLRDALRQDRPGTLAYLRGEALPAPAAPAGSTRAP